MNNLKNIGSIKPILIYMVFLVLFGPGAVSVFAQHYHFKTFPREEGLGESVVNTIFQDKKGYLWIGTYGGGADCFDGVNFTNYSTKNGLSDNSVFHIIGDRQGNTWFATFNGLTKYDGRKFTIYTVKNGLSSNHIGKMLEDRGGNLWLATDSNGVSRFDGKDFTNFSIDQGLSSNEVRSLLEDRRGNIWLGTLKGVSKYDGINFAHDAVTWRLNGYFVQTILEESSGNLWFGTKENGTFRFDSEKLTFTQYTTRQGLCSNDILHIMEDSGGKLWFSTPNGVSLLVGGIFTNYTTKHGLKQNRTDFILEDKEGNFWFANINGLVRFRGENFTFFNEKNGLANNAVLSIWEEGHKGIIWLGTRGGIAKYDRKNATVTMAADFNPRVHTGSFHEDRSGNLWFRAGKDVIKYDGEKFTNFSKKIGMSPLKVSSILDDRRGNIWFGTLYNGIRVWDGKTLKSFTKEDKLPHNRVNVLIEDERGNIWLGTEKGLVRYDGSNFTHISLEAGAIISPIMSIAVDQNRNLWIGTYGEGVTRFTPGGSGTSGPFVTLTTKEGLLDDEIVSMVFDHKENLWLASRKGLTVLDAAEFEKTGKKKFRYYTKEDGFIGIEPNDNAAYIDKEGNAWFGTMNGAIKFNPKKDKPNTIESATYATYSNLPPGEYAFKVEACNNEGLWNKEPAVYRFRIKPPFWQTWWFYLTGFLAVIISLYGFIKLRTHTLKKQKRILEEQVHFRTLELEQEKAKVEQFNRELEQRVEERTRKLAIANEKLLHAQKMEAIGTLAGGVAHDLNNILAGIVNYPELLLMDIPRDSPYRHTVLAIQHSGLKAAAIVQDMLTLARRGVTVTEVVNLNRVISEFLPSPEGKKIMASNPNVRMETHLAEDVPNIIGSPVHLSKTLMNLVSNAVEAMPYGGKLIIKTKSQYIGAHHLIKGYSEVKEGDYVMLMVSDTGIGMSESDIKHVFEPFYTKKKMGKSGTGLGMAVVWGTVQDHNGYITVQSSESEGEGEKKGTTFTLYFPATRLSLVQGESHLTMNQLMGNGESILVVDDVEEQREVTSVILKKLRYSVHTVDSGEEAVEYLKEHTTDLLVLDMIMEPGITGLETYKRVLQMYPGQKTILVSGYTETEEVREAQQLGAGTYVKKPYDLEKLGIAVKDELEKIRL